jgi:hypothetical protein
MPQSFPVSEPVGMHATSKLRTKLPDYSKDSIPEVSVTNEDTNDGRMERKYTDGRTPIMWIITEDNMYVMLLNYNGYYYTIQI